MFDPNLPIENTEIDAVQMRGQLNGLKDLIEAVQSITSAQVNGTTTLNPGDAASVSLSVIGSVLHFSFGIPRGQNGNDGGPGGQGQPGEVSNAQLSSAISGTSNITNGVSTLNMTVSKAMGSADESSPPHGLSPGARSGAQI